MSIELSSLPSQIAKSAQSAVEAYGEMSGMGPWATPEAQVRDDEIRTKWIDRFLAEVAPSRFEKELFISPAIDDKDRSCGVVAAELSHGI